MRDWLLWCWWIWLRCACRTGRDLLFLWQSKGRIAAFHFKVTFFTVLVLFAHALLVQPEGSKEPIRLHEYPRDVVAITWIGLAMFQLTRRASDGSLYWYEVIQGKRKKL